MATDDDDKKKKRPFKKKTYRSYLSLDGEETLDIEKDNVSANSKTIGNSSSKDLGEEEQAIAFLAPSLLSTKEFAPNRKTTGRKEEDKQEDDPSSSSSVLESEKLTTVELLETKNDALPEDWQEIDYSCLASYRFTENHLFQIYQSGKVTAEATQESIYEMHHDLTVNQNKTLRNPRNVLLSLLKKGHPYTSPGYESDSLKAERRCLEELKRRQSELTRIREEIEHFENLPAEMAQDALFKSWLSDTTEKQRREIAPQAKTDRSEGEREAIRSIADAQLGKLDN